MKGCAAVCNQCIAMESALRIASFFVAFFFFAYFLVATFMRYIFLNSFSVEPRISALRDILFVCLLHECVERAAGSYSGVTLIQKW